MRGSDQHHPEKPPTQGDPVQPEAGHNYLDTLERTLHVERVVPDDPRGREVQGTISSRVWGTRSFATDLATFGKVWRPV